MFETEEEHQAARQDRAVLIPHLHNEHGGYPAGHDFVLVSTADLRRVHAARHERARTGGLIALMQDHHSPCA